MIARPLDLASRLQKTPRSLDVFFYVNVGSLALFFALFGSPFVLAPGLGVDFRIPQVAGARAGAASVTCYLTVMNSGQILGGDGLLNWGQLETWLKAKTARDTHASLLIRAGADVPSATVERIISMAHASGFASVIWGAEEPPSGGSGENR